MRAPDEEADVGKSELTIDAIDAFVVPAMPLDIAHVQETEAETLRLLHLHEP